MTHAASWIAFAGLIIAVVACNKAFTEDATNYNLPIVQSAAPRAADLPAWRLYPTCTVNRTNVPILKENRT